MRGGNRSGFTAHGGFLGGLGRPTDVPRTTFDLNPYAHVSAAPATLSLAALTDLAVKPLSPFDFERDFQNPYIWNKLMFDPRLLPSNSFYRLWPDPEKLRSLFDPTPMNPPGGAPILPPQFR